MTCASCANRIERKLNKLDGVSATVNYATEKAKVTVPEGYDPALLVAEVEKTGYTATLPKPKASKTSSTTDGIDDTDEIDPELTSLRQRLIGSIVLTVPVIAMAMVPAFQFEYWQWASLTLAAPVIVWGHGRSTRPRGRISSTAPPRWTRSSQWARPRLFCGRCTHCSSAPPARPA